MKKLNLLLVLFLSIIITNCSDDDPSPVEQNILVGTWIGNNLEITGTLNTEIAGIPVSANFIGDVYDMSSTLTFTENPNNVISEGNYSVELSTTIQGQVFMENIENINFLESGTWQVVGNELRITTSTETVTAQIKELTVNSLILSSTSEEEVEIDGTTYGATINAEMFFERQ